MATTVDQKALKATKFPGEFSQKVDMQKVNGGIIERWIIQKLRDLTKSEDDVLEAFCYDLLQEERYPNIKTMQIKLTGFLDKDAAPFCKELWNLCLSAQASPQGVPKELLEAKKQALLQEKEQTEKAAEAARRQRESERERDRDFEDIRQRERAERVDRVDRGNNRGRGERAGRDQARDYGLNHGHDPGHEGGRERGRDGGRYDQRDDRREDGRSGRRIPDRRPRRNSSSPSPYRRRGSEEYKRQDSRRDVDSYIPSHRHGAHEGGRNRPKSPSRRRSLSRSRSRGRSSSYNSIVDRRMSDARSRSKTPPTHKDTRSISNRRRDSEKRSVGGSKEEFEAVGKRGDEKARYSRRQRSRSRSPSYRQRRKHSRSRSPAPKHRARYRHRSPLSESPK